LLNGLKILVTEDNELSQKIAHFILQKQGALVDAAYNGQQAIDLLQKNDYDVILMDLNMPEMGGYEATEYIRNTMKNTTPVIGLTASNWEEDLEKCIEKGMNACIVKPFNPENLCESILSVIKKENN
jgi:CheY-like chemotaxis protein